MLNLSVLMLVFFVQDVRQCTYKKSLPLICDEDCPLDGVLRYPLQEMIYFLYLTIFLKNFCPELFGLLLCS